jgi:hypothetical protein
LQSRTRRYGALPDDELDFVGWASPRTQEK